MKKPRECAKLFRVQCGIRNAGCGLFLGLLDYVFCLKSTRTRNMERRQRPVTTKEAARSKATATTKEAARSKATATTKGAARSKATTTDDRGDGDGVGEEEGDGDCDGKY